jgi:hypothetical protein
MHGRGDLPRDLRRAFANRDLDRMADLIDDELLDAIAIAGRPDKAPDRLRAWTGVAERVVLGVPWYALDQGRQRDAIEAALSSERASSPRLGVLAATRSPEAAVRLELWPSYWPGAPFSGSSPGWSAGAGETGGVGGVAWG